MDAALLEDLETLLPGRVTADPTELSLHARDFWPRLVMAERRGEELARPAAVVSPRSTEEVSSLLAWSHDRGIRIVPFGAGTGVCGGASADREAITLDLKRLDRVLAIDDVSGTVRVQPGIIAQSLEDHLAHRGWTLGHFPSSIHCSTIGGFLAIRSAGQTSSGHGKLEERVVALEVVLADGRVVRTRAVPSSSAGPDLTRLFIGAEGTTGVITEATLRLTPRPETVRDRGLLFPSFAAGLEAIRGTLRLGVTPTVFRLYDEADTALVFGGQGLDVPDGCLAVFGVEGEAEVSRFVHDRLLGELVAAGGQDLGTEPGEHWRRHRHDLSYRFAEYVKPGGTFGDAVALDTMEVAALWSHLPSLYEQVREALAAHADLVLTHASHVYPEGAALYFTFGAAPAGDEEAALRRYDAAWDAGQRAALDAGGTISHHHGVGLARVPWLREELGEAGYAVLAAVKHALDPQGTLNPGTLGLGSRR